MEALGLARTITWLAVHQSPGPQGVPGVQGERGAKGDRGADGIAGARGIDGAPCIAGVAGVKGDTGAQGVAGVNGAQGIAGVNGAAGVQGLAGATGAQGPKGDPGTPADVTAVTTLQGQMSGALTSISTLKLEIQAYEITDGAGKYVGRFISQPSIDVVWAAARVTTLTPPLGTVQQISDGVYEVSASTITVVSPVSPLRPLGQKWWTTTNCTGTIYIQDGSQNFAGSILYDEAPGANQRVYTAGAGQNFSIRSQTNPDGSCVSFPAIIRQAAPVSPKSTVNIVNTYNALNVGQFSAPFDVQALYLP